MVWVKQVPMLLACVTCIIAGSQTGQKQSLNRQLIDACVGDDLTGIRRSLARGADPNASDADGNTALMIILRSVRFTGMSYTPETSRRPRDGEVVHSFLIHQDRRISAAAKDTRAVRILLASGAKVTAWNMTGDTPMLLASFHKAPECLKLLLKHGATLAPVADAGKYALRWAAGYGHVETLRFLLNKA